MGHIFSSRFCIAIIACAACVALSAHAQDEAPGDNFLSNVRQLTFEGKRAGEGYFARDGRRIIFQSERMDDNPFYQIYLMDLETGDVNRVSPGHGKTTCSWIHPNEARVLFASTHDDPEAKEKQQAELDFRASGQSRRYSWDYDEHYELYSANFDGSAIKRLTNAKGYDAEGSWSPDGTRIVFSSNRHAYAEPMNAADAEIFERDKSYMMDIYIMASDGTNLRRLTDVKGYDGGPFFSPDGTHITWRRFTPDGATAEVYTMNADGTGQRKITELGAMSWAPFYHPSGDYLIFTTNLHGFANFELYIVDAQGERDPVRVTGTDGFDGLPVFTPDGAGLAWTSNRSTDDSSQIFMAKWNDAEARDALGLAPEVGEVVLEDVPDLSATDASIRVADLKTHISYLASEQMEGRRTGTIGARRATAYVAEVFKARGLLPAGDDGTYFQSFEFTAAANLGESNLVTLTMGDTSKTYEPEGNWRPLVFSHTGEIEATDIVFAGYGIQAPATDEVEEYDSFVHLDVTDKWVMVFRYIPEDISSEIVHHFNTHSTLRLKAMNVRELGARGLIVVSGPNSKAEEELVPLAFDISLSSMSMPAISITDDMAQEILDLAEKDLKSLQDELDSGGLSMGFVIPGAQLSAHIDITQERRVGRNVLARLQAGSEPDINVLVIGAHVDHLGRGRTNSSLARDEEKDSIHYGADDNASGVGTMLEIAEYLAALKRDGELVMRRDIIFAAWSGEELGTLGSYHFTQNYGNKDPKSTLWPEVAAYLNMDMVGRMGDQVTIQGVGSSSIWRGEIERRNAPVGLSIALQNEPHLPTDSRDFYLRGVPFLNAFTGAHEDYHSPRDTADKINYAGTEQIGKFMGLMARALVMREDAPDYVEVEAPENMEIRANLRAYLGTIPAYAGEEVKGVKLSGVTKGAPAQKAGLLTDDVIVRLGGKGIENIYDYTFALEALKIGETVEIVVERDGKRITLEITPGSRE